MYSLQFLPQGRVFQASFVSFQGRSFPRARLPLLVVEGGRGTFKLQFQESQLRQEFSGLPSEASYLNMSDFYLKVELLVANYSMYYKVNSTAAEHHLDAIPGCLSAAVFLALLEVRETADEGKGTSGFPDN